MGDMSGGRHLRLAFFPRALGLTALAYAVVVIAFAFSSALGPDRATGGLADLCRSDCQWYSSIAEQGYDAGPRDGSLQANVGFYPAFPLAVRAVMTITTLDFAPAAMLLNAVYTLLFAWLALSSREELLLRSDRDAVIFVLAFLLTPLSLYNRVPYTEAQFNLTLLATFVAWRRGAFAAAALAGLVLTATRVTGIFLPIALIVELLFRERWRIIELLQAPDARFRALAVMPLGAISFFAYLAMHLGDPLANFRLQAVAWRHSVQNPVASLIDGVTSLTLVGVTSGIAFAVAAVVLLTGAMRQRIPWPLALTGLGFASLPTVTGLVGLPRYALAIFVVYLAVPALPKWALWPLLVVFVPLQMFFVYVWLRY